MDPKIKFLSPLDPRVKIAPPPLDHIPSSVVKGVIHGLLTHLWRDKRRGSPEVVTLIKKRVFESVRQAVLLSPAMTEGQLSQAFEAQIPDMFKMSMKHNPVLFVFQSDFILDGLTCYKTIPTHAKRLEWLKREVPDLLNKLKEGPLCTECREKTLLPNNDTLSEWASSASIGGLWDSLLAYFHDGMKPSTVKKLLSSP
jgi:hypothetical protein